MLSLSELKMETDQNFIQPVTLKPRVMQLTAAIIIALSKNPNPTKGIALWKNTRRKRQKYI